MSRTFEEIMADGHKNACHDHSGHVFVWHQVLREEAINICSDVGKDACGVRPRWLNWDSMSLADINAQIDSFAEDVAAQEAEEKEHQQWERLQAAKRRRDNRYRPNNEMAMKLSRAFMRS